MLKKIILCFLFFSFTPLTLFLSVYLLNLRGSGSVLGESAFLIFQDLKETQQAVFPETGVIVPLIKVENSIPVIIKEYLNRYNSPLFPYSDNIVEAGRQYGVDPRLIVAIAQQESNLGKKSPPDCFNAWGWGIHERGTKCFSNWEEAIDIVTRGIARSYCDKGLCDDPCIMMRKYTPKSNGSWCAGVKQFLTEMETGNF